jgi:uncharacterized protein (DUF488 family)
LKPPGTPELFTIGYEGTTIDRVIAALGDAGIVHLLDVRALPNSRKPGFSRRQLEASVETAGMRYTHLRGLGTPKAGRDAARRGDIATMHRIFAGQLATPEAAADLERAVAISAEAPSCLLCFERDHAACHRDVVAGLIHARSGVRVVHLVAEAV